MVRTIRVEVSTLVFGCVRLTTRNNEPSAILEDEAIERTCCGGYGLGRMRPHNAGQPLVGRGYATCVAISASTLDRSVRT